MSVTVILRKEKYELPAPTTVAEALEALNLSPEMYLVLRDGILIDAQQPLAEGDVLQLIGVISGGSTLISAY
jgi:sulfur carrier protein ThiS